MNDDLDSPGAIESLEGGRTLGVAARGGVAGGRMNPHGLDSFSPYRTAYLEEILQYGIEDRPGKKGKTDAITDLLVPAPEDPGSHYDKKVLLRRNGNGPEERGEERTVDCLNTAASLGSPQGAPPKKKICFTPE